MNIGEKVIHEIVSRVLTVTRPERIILFGSAADGTMNPDSDIDVLVLETSPRNTGEESVIIRDVLRGLGYPFDVIVMSAERFEETKDIIGGIAFPAEKYGKIIYEAA